MELELKYKTAKDYKDILLKNGFSFKKEKRQIDNYYLVGDVLQERPLYLRVRQDILANTYSVDYHEIVSDIATKETEIDLATEDDFKKMMYILEGLNFKSKCVIDKKRKVYEKENITAVCDEIEQLGYFVEIEIEGEETQENLNMLKQAASSLGLEESNLVKGIGYPELWLEHNK